MTDAGRGGDPVAGLRTSSPHDPPLYELDFLRKKDHG